MAKLRILVLDRGFVVVALVKEHPTRAFWLRCLSRTIRVWGTSEGLGQLVGGPVQGQTRLDPPVYEDIPLRAVLREIRVEADKWKQHLSAPARRSAKKHSRSTPTG